VIFTTIVRQGRTTVVIMATIRCKTRRWGAVAVSLANWFSRRMQRRWRGCRTRAPLFARPRCLARCLRVFSVLQCRVCVCNCLCFVFPAGDFTCNSSAYNNVSFRHYCWNWFYSLPHRSYNNHHLFKVPVEKIFVMCLLAVIMLPTESSSNFH